MYLFVNIFNVGILISETFSTLLLDGLDDDYYSNYQNILMVGMRRIKYTEIKLKYHNIIVLIGP